MGKAKQAKDAASAADGLNLVWFFAAACVFSIVFFAFSVWLRTPPEKVVHLAAHKTQKKVIEKQNPRSAKGYQVNR